MSIRATNFVRSLRGLTATEKAVAFVMADHAHRVTGNITAGMTTIAAEAGLRGRETASRITKRLMIKGIFIPKHPPKKNQGGPTLYHVNYGVDAKYLAAPVPQKESPAPARSIPEPPSSPATGIFFGVTQENESPPLAEEAPEPEKPYLADPEAETLKYGRPLNAEERGLTNPRRILQEHEWTYNPRLRIRYWVSDEPIPDCFVNTVQPLSPEQRRIRERFASLEEQR
jgi:hypothetical protein